MRPSTILGKRITNVAENLIDLSDVETTDGTWALLSAKRMGEEVGVTREGHTFASHASFQNRVLRFIATTMPKTSSPTKNQPPPEIHELICHISGGGSSAKSSSTPILTTNS